MKLTVSLLALTLAVSASAQTATTQVAPGARNTAQGATPVHKTVSTTAKPATAAKTGTAAPKAGGPPPVHGIRKTICALTYVDLVVGTGKLAEPSVLVTNAQDSTVMLYTVKYTGWLAKDGTKFDSSEDHPGKEPITFPQGIGKVIPGWDSGFAGMHVGGKRRLYVPYQMAYGSEPKRDQAGKVVIPAKSDLIFDMELVDAKAYVPPPPPPPAPAKSDAPEATKPSGAAPASNTGNPAPDSKMAAPAPAPAPAAAPAKPETK